MDHKRSTIACKLFATNNHDEGCMRGKTFAGIFFVIVIACGACSKEFDPATAIHIAYESPMGCDEISGTVTLKASVRGDGAPVPAAMRYEMRTCQDCEPLVLMGYPPTFEAEFDTTGIRDGFVYYRAVPLDAPGNEINLQALRYTPFAMVPKFRGIMINNGTMDLSRPLIVFGAETEPYSGELTGTWTADQIVPHLTFAANLMEHLREVGNIPELCFSDDTTLVMDPADPLAENLLVSDALVDMLGESVSSMARHNRGTVCLPTPFFEVREPNGIPDIWENTAFDNIQAYTRYGSVQTEPVAFAFYDEISRMPADTHNGLFQHQSYFGFRKPVRNAAPENLLKEKLRTAIAAGATCVLIYDVYLKTNDFEMSVGSWPFYQKTVDELNHELGTSVRVGALTTNQSQLMQYDNFLRSLHLGLRDTIRTSNIPPDKKFGIILVEHGSSRSGRLYDVLRLSTAALNDRLVAYFAPRIGSLYNGNAALAVSYIEGTYPPADNVSELNEQVEDWVKEGYEYIVIYPVDWFWESRQTYQDLRRFAVERIDKNNTGIYLRDDRDRTELQLGTTRLIISETTLSKKTTCPAAVHYLKTAAAQLLEDRLITMTGSSTPKMLVGTITVEAGGSRISVTFSDRLVAQNGKMFLHQAGIRGAGTTAPDRISGALDREDMGNYIYALLVENGITIESVTVSEARLDLAESHGAIQGSITARACVLIDGTGTELVLTISAGTKT